MTDELVSAKVGTDLLFENGVVRVWRLALGPGESSDLHVHMNDYVFVFASPGYMELSFADGSPPLPQPSDEGLVHYREVGPSGLPPHRLTNVDDRSSTHYLIELLGPSRSPETQAPEHNGRFLPVRQQADDQTV
jgi:hypothetical protein